MFKLTSNEIDLGKFDLIIPSVSVGNVAQLAVDLIINTFNFTRCGFIWHPNILPCIGSSDRSDGGISLACELFYSPSLKLAALQIRSTYGHFETIKDFLVDFCKKFQRVILLTSTFAYERKEIHLVTEPIRYLTGHKLFTLPKNWKPLEVHESKALHLPGSGIADKLYTLLRDQEVPILLIVQYVSEGDNRVDAAMMASFINSLFNFFGSSDNRECWKSPQSWELLFGGPPPKELF